MSGENGKRQYHPAFRLLTWAVPLLAAAAVIVLLMAGEGEDAGRAVEITPPPAAGIPYVGFC